MDYDCGKCNHLPVCAWSGTEFEPVMCPHYTPASPVAPAVDAGKCKAGIIMGSEPNSDCSNCEENPDRSKPAADKEG